MPTAMDKLLKKLEQIEARIETLEKNLMTCVGDRCKVIDNELKTVKDEQTKIIEQINKEAIEKVSEPAQVGTNRNKYSCPNCDLEIEEGQKVCPHCEEKLEWEEIDEE